MNELPKFYETFIPILQVLKSGEVMHYNDLKKKVKDLYYNTLSDEALSLQTKAGDPLILNRIGWGKAYLKQAKMVHIPSRGMVQITPKGLITIQKGSLSLKDIKNDPDYLEHEVEKKTPVSNDIVNEDASPQDMIDSGVQSIENEVKTELLERLKSINPYYFERVVLELFNKMGYGEFQETSKSGDGGIDGVINQDVLGLEKIFVQAKRYNGHNVRELELRNFIGAMNADTYKGIFVTTSSFEPKAVQKAKDARHTIILIDGIHLSDLMYRFGIGVQVENTYEVKDIDEDYFIK
jgi:restriction system protein